MYFLLPGLGLCVLAAVMLATVKVDKVVAAAPVQRQPVGLAPPRPGLPPPQPPQQS